MAENAKLVPPTAPQAVVINDHRRVMSALKASSPIIQAMIVAPGSNADAGMRAAAISDMVKASHVAAECMIDTLAPDLKGKGWARSDAFLFCAGVIAEEWKATKNIGLATSIIDEELLEQMQASVLGSDSKALNWMDRVNEYPPIIDHCDAATRLRMSLMKASTPMVMEINRFAFWQNAEKRTQFIESMVSNISELAASHANEMADKFAMSPEDRISLWQGDLQRVFVFAIEEYRCVAQIATSNVEAIAKDTIDESLVRNEQVTWFRKAASGEIQRDILSKVISNFAILDGVANRLAMTMAGAQNRNSANAEARSIENQEVSHHA